MLQGQSDTVFVPLSGLVSVNKEIFMFKNMIVEVFVPLSGLVSVNLLGVLVLSIIPVLFSSPYRG